MLGHDDPSTAVEFEMYRVTANSPPVVSYPANTNRRLACPTCACRTSAPDHVRLQRGAAELTYCQVKAPPPAARIIRVRIGTNLPWPPDDTRLLPWPMQWPSETIAVIKQARVHLDVDHYQRLLVENVPADLLGDLHTVID